MARSLLRLSGCCRPTLAGLIEGQGAPQLLTTRCMASVAATGLAPRSREDKAELVKELLAAKAASGKTFSQIAAEVGLTNGQTAQLFFNQAQLKPGTREKLAAAVPALTEEQLVVMGRPPMRSFNPDLIQEPLVYRLYEAVMHYGEALKAVTNEEFDDGIMSAIDFYCTVDRVKGAGGEDRVVITFNGKFLPHVEQLAENNTAAKK